MGRKILFLVLHLVCLQFAFVRLTLAKVTSLIECWVSSFTEKKTDTTTLRSVFTSHKKICVQIFERNVKLNFD